MSWEVGEKVLRRRTRSEVGEICTVEKVYKNGNAVVDGRQFRESGHNTSKDSWNHDRIDRLTETVLARHRKAKLHAAAMKKLDVLRQGLSVENINLQRVDELLGQAVEATIDPRPASPNQQPVSDAEGAGRP